jgi:hypothetical protein
MKRTILKATLLAVGMFWATASFANGTNYKLFIDIFNDGDGDKVTWSFQTGCNNPLLVPSTPAQRTAVYADSSSWAIDFTGNTPFDLSDTFRQPVIFEDDVRKGYFNIVKFTDPNHLTLDVRQGFQSGTLPTDSDSDFYPDYDLASFSDSDSVSYQLYLKSSGNDYTNPVAAVPEPETYALLLAGLALVGAAAKRRKAK